MSSYESQLALGDCAFGNSTAAMVGFWFLPCQPLFKPKSKLCLWEDLSLWRLTENHLRGNLYWPESDAHLALAGRAGERAGREGVRARLCRSTLCRFLFLCCACTCACFCAMGPLAAGASVVGRELPCSCWRPAVLHAARSPITRDDAPSVCARLLPLHSLGIAADRCCCRALYLALARLLPRNGHATGMSSLAHGACSCMPKLDILRHRLATDFACFHRWKVRCA